MQLHTHIHKITINDNLYRYAVYPNSETDESGIFLIGNLQEIESVEFFSTEFSKALNIIVIELPGTGLTDPLPAWYSIQDQAILLHDFIKKLKIESAHILAFSYAVPVALEFCLLYEGALSLSMCGGMAGIPTKSRADTMAIMAAALRDRKAFAEELIAGLTVVDKNIPRGHVIARSAKQKVYKYTDKQIDCFCENTIRILAYKPSNLSTISIPCLLFIGQLDPYVTPENATALSNQLTQCQLIYVPNADHLVHLEQSQTTADLMIQLAKEDLCDKSLNYIEKIRA